MSEEVNAVGTANATTNDVVNAVTEAVTAAATSQEKGKSTPATTAEVTTNEFKAEDFKIPDGFTADQTALNEFAAMAKEAKLTKDQAQKMVDMHVKALTGTQTKTVGKIEDLKKQWAQDAIADQEIGGTKLPENLAVAKKALDQFATPAFRKFLEDSGFGNHPEMIRTFFKIGTSVSEGRMVPADGALTPERTLAERMYPNMNSKTA
jgi:hypothetical protein